MAFCATCDEPVEITREDASPTGCPQADHATHYDCTDPECPNDGGVVFADAQGRVIREEGVW